MAGVLGTPTRAWFDKSLSASALWEQQRASISEMVANATRLTDMNKVLGGIRADVSSVNSLLDIARRANFDKVVEDILAPVPPAVREEATAALEGLVPPALDSSPEADAVRKLVLLLLLLVLLTGFLTPEAGAAMIAAGEQLLSTADLIIDKTVAAGVALNQNAFVQTGSFGFTVASLAYFVKGRIRPTS